MRAMLKAVKIDSYLVSIFPGDPDYVREEWPSPQQFNHCIIAVKVSDETKFPESCSANISSWHLTTMRLPEHWMYLT